MNIKLKIKYRQLVLALLLSFVIGTIQTAIAAIDYTYALDESVIRIDTVESPTGNKFIKLFGDKFWSNGIAGQPDVPYTVVRFLVPEYACDFSVSITRLTEKMSLNSDLKLYPVQEHTPMSEHRSDFFTEPDEKNTEPIVLSFLQKYWMIPILKEDFM